MPTENIYVVRKFLRMDIDREPKEYISLFLITVVTLETERIKGSSP